MPNRPSKAEHVASTTGGEQMTETRKRHLAMGLDFNQPQSEPEQLKMFMTPREIHAGYQPLDEDRMTQANDPARGSAALTFRDENTFGDHNVFRGYNQDRTQGGTPRYLRTARETDDEVWQRKLSEAKEFGPRGQYGEYGVADPNQEALHGALEKSDPLARYDDAGAGTPTLHSSIAAEGVKAPIRLGMTTGSSGKREVVGGHHRLAAATDIDQDRLVPVLHDENVNEAQKPSKSYPYA